MEKASSIELMDPVVGRLLRTPSGLRASRHTSSGHEVLATYWHDEGGHPFAICRDGLLIDPDESGRFISFHQIKSTSLHDSELLLNEKNAMRVSGSVGATSLLLALTNGETLILPLNARADRMSERLTIAGLIEQRVRIARSERRRAQASGT